MQFLLLAAVNDGLSISTVPLNNAKDFAEADMFGRDWLEMWQHDFTQAVIVTSDLWHPIKSDTDALRRLVFTVAQIPHRALLVTPSTSIAEIVFDPYDFSRNGENARFIPANFVEGWTMPMVLEQSEKDAEEMHEYYPLQRRHFMAFCEEQDNRNWDLS